MIDSVAERFGRGRMRREAPPLDSRAAAMAAVKRGAPRVPVTMERMDRFKRYAVAEALALAGCDSAPTRERGMAARVPGTNIRRPRARDASEVITKTYPERRIIEPELSDAVRARATAVRARYKSKSGAMTAPGHPTRFPLSGLLVCGRCGAAMVISSGTSASYYSCGDARKRGTCPVSAMLREEAVRAAVFGALRQALFTPDAIAHLRKRIAERLRAAAQTGASEVDERVGRLRRTEERIQGLVRFISEGDDSPYVRSTLKDLEAQARADGAAIDELKRSLRAPVPLPSPDELLDRARDLEAAFATDPTRAREALRGVFVDGRIAVDAKEDGSWVARASLLPLVAVGGPGAKRDPAEGAVVVALEIAIPKPPDRRFKKNITT